MAQHDITHLITRIQAVGGTVEQLLALDNIGTTAGADLNNLEAWDASRFGPAVFAWNRKAEDAAVSFVEKLENRARPATTTTAPRATDRQVDYALNLIALRRRSGGEGGWLTFTGGTPTRDQLAQMSRRDISTLIDQLRDSYSY